MANAPTTDQVRDFHRNYPTNYAQCRTWRHGPEQPLTVERPYGPSGVIEVTRICACGRRVTRVYTPRFERLTDQTRISYPPGYLALPGMGGVEKPLIVKRAVEAELELLRAGARGAVKAAVPEPEPVEVPAFTEPESNGGAAKSEPEPSAPEPPAPEPEMPPRPRKQQPIAKKLAPKKITRPVAKKPATLRKPPPPR